MLYLTSLHIIYRFVIEILNPIFKFFNLQINFHINLIFFILFYTKISLGYSIRRMIIQFHQHGRRCALLPGMIAKSLSQGVAADMFIKTTCTGGCLNNTIGLITGEGKCLVAHTWEQIVVLGSSVRRVSIFKKNSLCGFIDWYSTFLACFMFFEANVGTKTIHVIVPYIPPLHTQ